MNQITFVCGQHRHKGKMFICSTPLPEPLTGTPRSTETSNVKVTEEDGCLLSLFLRITSERLVTVFRVVYPLRTGLPGVGKDKKHHYEAHRPPSPRGFCHNGWLVEVRRPTCVLPRNPPDPSLGRRQG